MATTHKLLPTLPFLVATITTIIASSISCCRAFTTQIITLNNNQIIVPSSTSLYGIQEWRDQAYEEHYTLEIFNQAMNPDKPPQIPATVPILPFPFTDILMQGQRKQLNLYEKRFHDLFQDAMENHHGMIGMGLLLGRGMITTMPLCEVESFTRFGYDENNWVDTGNGMGNGSIFVTIRAVGRAKIVESDLIQEEPYFKARVVEVMDEPINMEVGIGIKERVSSSSSDNKVSGESSPVQIGSLVASTIENLMVTLSSMEHKLKEINDKKKKEGGDDFSFSPEVVSKQDDNVENNQGYILQPTTATDNLSSEKIALRSPKDLTAISWAAFCTGSKDGSKNSIQRQAIQIQALDMTNVIQRMQLASAMLREEQNSLKAKLALAGIQDILKGGDGGVGDELA
ncbi:hypothetical protein ACHAXM_001297 [Skeletonema potamos]